VAVTHTERQMLMVIAASEKPSGAHLAHAVPVAPEEFSSALRSLHEKRLVRSYVPLGGPDIPAVGWLEITPRGREVLQGRDDLR
jgi:hypothetical protein